MFEPIAEGSSDASRSETQAHKFVHSKGRRDRKYNVKQKTPNLAEVAMVT